MRRVCVIECDETSETDVVFTFDSRDSAELSEASSIMQASRCMAPIGTRLGIEIDANVAYLQTLAAGLCDLAAPPNGEASEVK